MSSQTQGIRSREIVRLNSRQRMKVKYKYIVQNSKGQRFLSSNDYYVALSTAEAHNLEMVENIGTIKVKKKQYFRQKVHRKITQQIELF